MLTELRTVRGITLADGGAPAGERAAGFDRALASLVAESTGPMARLSVVAVGGYGRGELSPHSDIDLLVLTGGGSDITPATVRGLLYPLWDAGFEVGHAVRTPKEAVDRAATDLDAATSILSARLIGGDSELFGELLDRRRRWIARDAKAIARRIVASTRDRHERVERAGWVLAPDLKEDVGGLRDVHRLRWLAVLGDGHEVPPTVREAEGTLLVVREALHACGKRRNDKIHIDLQPQVARLLALSDDGATNELMHHVHLAARAIEHHGGAAEQRIVASLTAGPSRSGMRRMLRGAARVDDGVITIAPGAGNDLGGALAIVAARSQTEALVAPSAAEWLTETFATAPAMTWTQEMRERFNEILRGPHVVEALELVDHTGGWPSLLPEWLRIRALAQHDPYHRYTVDGHLFVAVSELHNVLRDDRIAAIAAEEAGELDDLYLATLLHDIGKGSGEDHSVAGERLARDISNRMGLDATRAAEVASLVRNHLTLVDTATRRDLDDGGVIAHVAETVGDPRRLRLLYILTIADGKATGPEGWSDWKGALVRDLYKKVLAALETGEVPARSDVRIKAEEVEAYEPALAGRALEMLETLPPSYLSSTHLHDIVDDLRLLVAGAAPGEIRHRVDEGAEPGEVAVTLCTPDRPGALARTAGVLSLHRLGVLRAQAFSTSRGLALQRFIVAGDVNTGWDKVLSDLKAAYAGRLALEARLEHKISEYGGRVGDLDIRILGEASQHSTVIEVRSADALGLLYGIAAALGDLDLDIHVAKIDTRGARVVDVFYVRTAWGARLDREQYAEVDRAIRHRVSNLYRS